jgi:hypothetical protein
MLFQPRHRSLVSLLTISFVVCFILYHFVGLGRFVGGEDLSSKSASDPDLVQLRLIITS